jgi:D-3-phosphoglycerate dehydrogenase
MKKILITTSSFESKNLPELVNLQKQNFEIVFNPLNKRLTESELLNIIDENVVAMIAGIEPITSSVIQKASSLKVISRCGIGIDNIDLNFAYQNGIEILNTPDAPSLAVAELTLAHILSFLRKIPGVNNNLKNGIWKPEMGALLFGKIVGIIGYGRIGSKIATLLESFGAIVKVFDPNINNITDKKFVDFDTLISLSDIITLHLPYTNNTHHMINYEVISKMKSNCLLINISRGGLINEEDLYQAIIEKKIIGACLDCFEEEPYSGKLKDLPSIQMTAHMGSYAIESRVLQEKESVINLMLALKKLNIVNNE